MKTKLENPTVLTTSRFDVPPWMRGDRYVRTGYRRPLNSVYLCITSLFYIHNEWVNVWSHLGPGVVHAFLLAKECHAFSQERDAPRYMDRLIVWQYITSCICCLLFSVRSHHSGEEESNIDNARLDSTLSQHILARSRTAG